MSDTNIVILRGRLTKAAELKTLTSGTPCTNMSMAVNESRKNAATGGWDSIASYFDVVSYGKYAAAAIASLTKGREVLVSGRLKQDRWDKNGETFSRIMVIAENLEILREPKNPAAQGASPADTATGTDGLPDDLPF